MAKVYGPYIRDDGRRYVIVKRGRKRETTLYSRYLMEKHLGRKLEPHEHVDHINDDPTDDRIENLQIISQLDNTLKYHALHPKEIHKFNCPICGKEAERDAEKVRKEQKRGVAGPFCSRSCAGKYSKTKRPDSE